MASTSSPMRRNTSASVRTVVVLPVPPLSDRTAIVSAMARDSNVAEGERRRRSSSRLAGETDFRALLARQDALRRGRADRRRVQVVDGVAADHDLVAVGQRRPLDALAVDVDAVERAVVEHAYALRLADHERMTARDRGVVEADVGGERAPDARPLLVERDQHVAAGLLVGEVLARLGHAVARLLQPRGALALHGRGRLDGHRLLPR